MKCNKCNIAIKCKDSRGENNRRYRRYECPKCGNYMYTEEKEIEEDYVKYKLTYLNNKYRQKE